MRFNREATRQRRIAAIEAGSLEWPTAFLGFGGSSVACETLVYVHQPTGAEIRVPVFPHLFQPEQVEAEYGCISDMDWTAIGERLTDLIEATC